MAEQQTAEARLSPELMAEVCRALNFDPAAFAQRHGEEFVHLYLRLDQMLAYVGEEIVAYLAKRVNECLSKAEYALLSYIEYAGREAKHAESDGFAQAVANYLKVRRKTGSEWVYAFEKNESLGENGGAKEFVPSFCKEMTHFLHFSLVK